MDIMSNSLSQEEIKKHLVRLTNLKKLHPAQLKHNKKLLQENKQLKERVAMLEMSDKKKHKIIETLKLQMEELQKIVFGKSKKNKKNESDKNDIDIENKDNGNEEGVQRTAGSYKRKTPKESDITERKESKISTCPDCETKLSKKETKVFYIEDIEIPKKTVTEQKIEKGFCAKCKK